MAEYQLRYTDTTRAPVIVKDYTVNGANNPTNINDGLYPHATNSNTSLVFVGKGKFDYGEPIQTNLLRLLENFSSPNPPDQPTSGQLWYNNLARVLSVWNGTTWDTISVNAVQTGDLDMNGYRIINLENPANDHDAVNLKYVTDRFAKLIGDTFIGPVYMNDRLFVSNEFVVHNPSFIDMGMNRVRNVDDPIADNDAANKFYVDDMANVIQDNLVNGGLLDYRYALKAGDTFTGMVNANAGLTASVIFTTPAGTVINVGGNRIQQVGDPTANADAVNKLYVDTGLTNLQNTAVNGSLLDHRYVRKTGDTMSGTYDMSGTYNMSGTHNYQSGTSINLTDTAVNLNATSSVTFAGTQLNIDLGTY